MIPELTKIYEIIYYIFYIYFTIKSSYLRLFNYFIRYILIAKFYVCNFKYTYDTCYVEKLRLLLQCHIFYYLAAKDISCVIIYHSFEFPSFVHDFYFAFYSHFFSFFSSSSFLFSFLRSLFYLIALWHSTFSDTLNTFTHDSAHSLFSVGASFVPCSSSSSRSSLPSSSSATLHRRSRSLRLSRSPPPSKRDRDSKGK